MLCTVRSSSRAGPVSTCSEYMVMVGWFAFFPKGSRTLVIGVLVSARVAREEAAKREKDAMVDQRSGRENMLYSCRIALQLLNELTVYAAGTTDG